MASIRKRKSGGLQRLAGLRPTVIIIFALSFVVFVIVASVSGRRGIHESDNPTTTDADNFTSLRGEKLPEVVPSVEIASGTHKYVLISARKVGAKIQSYFVTSKRDAKYHRIAAKPMLERLGHSGLYQDVNVTGGGRLTLFESNKTIFIYGYSKRYGRAMHETSKQVILADPRYQDYSVTWSNEGY